VLRGDPSCSRHDSSTGESLQAVTLTVSCTSKLVARVTKPLAHRVASIVCDCNNVPLSLE